jgi:hypothetical protein
MSEGNGNGSAIKGLDIADIKALFANSRNRGVYGKCLHTLIEDSDEAAVNVRETWPLEFSETKAGAMYQSFRIAAKNAELIDVEGKSDVVKILRQKDDVYIIHMERFEALEAEEVAA